MMVLYYGKLVLYEQRNLMANPTINWTAPGDIVVVVQSLSHVQLFETP